MTRGVLVAHCRAGFEPEAAIDLGRIAAAMRTEIQIDAPAGRGYVAGDVELRGAARALEQTPPIFIRSLFVGTGPHSLLDPASATKRPDRITGLLALTERTCAELPWSALSRSGARSTFASLRLESADTNEGKALSSLTRSLDARLVNELRTRGLVAAQGDARSDAAGAAHLHVLFADGANAYVGASLAPWASRWPMGIPRLRMPHGAPSRSTLKLAEAFVTFLAERELELLRAGMRAVDLGASPGGWTWQLAHRGLRVTAVDNGPLKGEVRDDPLVTHVRADGLSYRPRRPVDWMVCDIVEQPARIAALVARWLRDGDAPRAIFNLKLPMKRRYDEVRRCTALIGETLDKARIAHTLTLRQLYHDRDEITGYVAAGDAAGGKTTTSRRG